ncbi:ERMES complex subunit mmm1 [Malassezia brasiliensis]|uniref:Maintenance of mitochondrial morphology protein 1 n=1 Tax=Malassezia brasiliensis TaxID=1821822 RepID=A0AAF0DUH8_9BASI|nr:ERMES complex subunit mmm1 [Malassezia brasiliensis]
MNGPETRLTFAQGFVAGQIVLGLVLAYVFWSMFMTNVPESLSKQRSDLMERTRILQKSLDARSKRPVDRNESYERNFQARLQGILERTKYDIDHHAPESLDWLNLMVAQTMHGYRESILHTSRGMHDRDTDLPLPSLATEEKAAAKRFVERLLNGAVEGRTMNVLDTITVTDIDFGFAYPAFSNARFSPSDHLQGVRLEVDFDYVDRITLGLDTKLLFNFPQLRFGSLALALCFRIERIAGTLGIEVGTQEHNPAKQEIRVCLYPDFVLEAHVSSLIGSKNQLQDTPKIEQILVSRLHMAIQQYLVWPKFFSIPLPGLE